MKIIQNNIKSAYPKECICNNCKSIVEIEQSDVIKIVVKGYDPRDNEPYTYPAEGYCCPCCNKETQIKEIKDI